MRRARVVVAFEGAPVAWANEIDVVQIAVGLLLHACRELDPRSSDHEVHLRCGSSGSTVEVAVEAPLVSGSRADDDADDLTMCRRVVASLDGVLRISRDEGKTLFVVTLPAFAPEERNSLPPRAA